MLKFLLINIISTILGALALLHFYWVFGGKWALKGAIPEKWSADYFDPKNKTKIALATLIVSFGLLFFAFIILSNDSETFSFISERFIKIATRVIAAIFIIRAIGDFNIVGLFKKDSDSLFAKKDKTIYVPLCLFLGISSIVISIL